MVEEGVLGLKGLMSGSWVICMFLGNRYCYVHWYMLHCTFSISYYTDALARAWSHSTTEEACLQ